MKTTMRTLIYGNNHDCAAAEQLLRSMQLLADRSIAVKPTETWDDCQVQLVDWKPTLAIVLTDGAAGMEGVFLVKKHTPKIPVFWFSDDCDFGIQSHRLECDYFAVKPLTYEKLERAFVRCTNVGVVF